MTANEPLAEIINQTHMSVFVRANCPYNVYKIISLSLSFRLESFDWTE